MIIDNYETAFSIGFLSYMSNIFKVYLLLKNSSALFLIYHFLHNINIVFAYNIIKKEIHEGLFGFLDS